MLLFSRKGRKFRLSSLTHTPSFCIPPPTYTLLLPVLLSLYLIYCFVIFSSESLLSTVMQSLKETEHKVFFHVCKRKKKLSSCLTLFAFNQMLMCIYTEKIGFIYTHNRLLIFFTQCMSYSLHETYILRIRCMS